MLNFKLITETSKQIEIYFFWNLGIDWRTWFRPFFLKPVVITLQSFFSPHSWSWGKCCLSEALKSCKLFCDYLKFLSKSLVFKFSPDLSKHTFRAGISGTILLLTSASFQNNTVLGEVQGELHLWCTYFGMQLQKTELNSGCNYICLPRCLERWKDSHCSLQNTYTWTRTRGVEDILSLLQGWGIQFIDRATLLTSLILNFFFCMFTCKVAGRDFCRRGE